MAASGDQQQRARGAREARDEVQEQEAPRPITCSRIQPANYRLYMFIARWIGP